MTPAAHRLQCRHLLWAALATAAAPGLAAWAAEPLVAPERLVRLAEMGPDHAPSWALLQDFIRQHEGLLGEAANQPLTPPAIAAVLAEQAALRNDIPDSCKLASGRIDIVPHTQNLQHLLPDLQALIAMSAEGKGLRLPVVAADSVPQSALADGKRVEQILFNLLPNAAKFTAQGEVSLLVRALPAADDGRSGAAHELNFVVRDITIGSAPGEGACFTLRLVLPAAVPDRAAAGPTPLLANDGADRADRAAARAGVHRPAHAGAGRPAGHPDLARPAATRRPGAYHRADRRRLCRHPAPRAGYRHEHFPLETGAS